mgnify:CR=1 FL=1
MCKDIADIILFSLTLKLNGAANKFSPLCFLILISLCHFFEKLDERFWIILVVHIDLPTTVEKQGACGIFVAIKGIHYQWVPNCQQQKKEALWYPK